MTKPTTYEDAMNLLNLRRQGADMPDSYVLRALELTGDYEPKDKYRQPQFVRLFDLASA